MSLLLQGLFGTPEFSEAISEIGPARTPFFHFERRKRADSAVGPLRFPSLKACIQITLDFCAFGPTSVRLDCDNAQLRSFLLSLSHSFGIEPELIHNAVGLLDREWEGLV